MLIIKWTDRITNDEFFQIFPKMLIIKWTDRITNDEFFQRAKGVRLLLKILKK